MVPTYSNTSTLEDLDFAAPAALGVCGVAACCAETDAHGCGDDGIQNARNLGRQDSPPQLRFKLGGSNSHLVP